jgi:hypothetical protein
MAEEDLLCFNDGFVLDRDTILVAAQRRADARDDVSVAVVIKNGIWTRLTVEDALVSVVGLRSSRNGFYLGANGTVLIIGPGQPQMEAVGDIPQYGEMLRIRNIAEHIYACGMNGQVYVRANNIWQLVGKNLLGTAQFDVEDIDGTGPNDLWAVGTMSDVWHWDGQIWQRADMPTDRPFSGVQCLSRDRIYVCGDDGNFFVGNGEQWTFIGDPEIDDNLWAVEQFGDNLFLAFDGGLMRYDGTSLTKLDLSTVIPGKVDGYRLSATTDVLWSFGIDTLLRYDGRQWQHVDQPLP